MNKQASMQVSSTASASVHAFTFLPLVPSVGGAWWLDILRVELSHSHVLRGLQVGHCDCTEECGDGKLENSD